MLTWSMAESCIPGPGAAGDEASERNGADGRAADLLLPGGQGRFQRRARASSKLTANLSGLGLGCIEADLCK